MVELLGRERADRSFRFRELIESGAVFSLGSDWPASASLSTYRTLDEIEIAHTRQALGASGGPVLPPADERLGLEQIIEAATLNRAIQMGLENRIGSIEVGKFADLIVLDKNLFAVEPNDIHKTKLLFTMMNGGVTHRAPDFE
jgi:predicted amidohydrolase YtcJ